MTTETIELLKILRDVTQSRSVYDRCSKELGKLGASLACVEHNKTIADEVFDCAIRDLIETRMGHSQRSLFVQNCYKNFARNFDFLPGIEVLNDMTINGIFVKAGTRI